MNVQSNAPIQQINIKLFPQLYSILFQRIQSFSSIQYPNPMSYKLLPTYQHIKNRTFFYKSPEIRFKQLISKSVVKPIRRRIIIEDDPWRSMKDTEVNKLIQRLDDKPDELYEVIKKRHKKKNKFILLATEDNKQNTKILENIEAKRKYYENQFKSLLKNRKSETINILLPKLESVHYIFKDKLHKLKLQERKEGSMESQ